MALKMGIGNHSWGFTILCDILGNLENNNEAHSANSCDELVINLQRASQLQFWRIQQKRQRNAFSLFAFNHSAFCGQHRWQIHTVIKNPGSKWNLEYVTMCDKLWCLISSVWLRHLKQMYFDTFTILCWQSLTKSFTAAPASWVTQCSTEVTASPNVALPHPRSVRSGAR